MPTLLTKHNSKLMKSEGYGYKSFGMHLAPYKLAGKNMCTSASKGCAAACLNTSGHGIYQRVQESRLKKTKFFIENREEFLATLYREISAKVKTATRTGQKISFRLNLTSDVLWEQVKYQGKNFMEHFPDVQFMDYTKHYKRMCKFIDGEFAPNYHLTFSRSEDNEQYVLDIMKRGGNVAVVFDKYLPKTFRKKKVISGDLHDLRFLDKKGVVVGLTAKGKGKRDKTGFVINPKTGK